MYNIFACVIPCLILMCFILLWGLMIKQSQVNKSGIPWAFLLVILSVFVDNWVTKVQLGDTVFEISPSIFIVLILVTLNRKKLGSFHMSIGRKDFLANVAYGLILGVVMGIAAYVFLDERVIVDKEISILSGFWSIFTGGIIEEIVFRGFILGYISLYNPLDFRGNLAQGFLFGIVHLGRYWNYYPGLIFVTGFGLLAGWLTQKYQSIVGATVAHVLMNLVPFLLINVVY